MYYSRRPSEAAGQRFLHPRRWDGPKAIRAAASSLALPSNS
jgi:hypothetical protein